MVAQVRGARFAEGQNKERYPEDVESRNIAHVALGDVVAWLGFDSANEYMGAMGQELSDIFKRATY